MSAPQPLSRITLTLVLALWAIAAGAAPPLAVLVHGYLGDRESWAEAGVEAALEGAGWQDGGAVVPTPSGMALTRPGRAADEASFYTVELPSEAPVLFQARVLGAAVQRLRARRPDAPLVLVGHSAGGVVARAWLVTQPDADARALVTIASPHLGTDRAGLGIAAGRSPLGMFAPFMGLGSLNRSQGLYADLVPARPGTFLHWLNRQPHPEAVYVSVVRGDDDAVVPPRSQHLGNVPALAGRTRSLPSAGGHLLQGGDGPRLVRILERLRAGANPRP